MRFDPYWNWWSYIDSAAITGFSTSLVIFRHELGLREWQVGAAAAALTLSVAVGAAVGGRLGDRFGRRPVFTVTMILIVAAIVGLILAPSFEVVIVGAVLLGFATGADLPVSLATIAEAASDENRGRLLGFSNLLWVVGVVMNTLLASIVVTPPTTSLTSTTLGRSTCLRLKASSWRVSVAARSAAERTCLRSLRTSSATVLFANTRSV